MYLLFELRRTISNSLVEVWLLRTKQRWQTPRRQIYLVLESVCPHENKNMHKPLVCKITSSQLHLNQIHRKWQRVLMMDDEQKTGIC